MTDTPTPRTDAERFTYEGIEVQIDAVPAALAVTLERDLSECRAALEVAAGTLDAASIEARDWFLTGLADDLAAAAKAARAILQSTGEGEGK